jgi:membrane protein DedA with SNARE-associated domain
MAQFLEQLGSWIEQLIQTIGYPGIAFMMFAENVFPPIPSELIMPFAGFLVGRGEFNFVGVVVAGVLGSVLGAIVLYYIGMWAGDKVLRAFLRRYGYLFTVSEKEYDRALSFFARYGDVIVFFGRLIPLVRSIISIPAGANHMPLPKFILFTAIGSAIWSGVLAYAGVALGENWEQVIGFVENYQDIVTVVVAIIGVVFAGWIVSRIISRSRAGTLKADAETRD